jgi:DNA topoisomerase-3
MVVIYAEKHSLAKTIAEALKAGNRIACKKEPTVAHWEFALDGEAAVICHGVGHLAELVPAKTYGEQYAKWDLDNFPCVPDEFLKEPIEKSKNCFDYVKGFFDRADRLINATDPDREGELIFAYVMETMNCNKPFKRVWLDDLTDTTIIKAFNNLKDGAEVIPLQFAGRARDIADWLVGINLTIAMTKKFGGAKSILSVGRVQTPTLNLVVRREKEIKNHVKTPFWKLNGVFFTSGDNIEAEHAKGKFENEAEAQAILSACNGKDGTITVKNVKNKTEAAPLLYNATGLQTAAGKKLGWELEKTVEIMQSLYENKLMSYPRTSSEHLTDEMRGEVAETIEKLMKLPEYSKYAAPHEQWLEFSKRHFDNAKVGSHTAIIPTAAVPNDLSGLSEDERQLYDLLVKSLLRIVYPKAEIEETALEIDVDGNIFKASGSVIKNNGWYAVDALPEKKAVIPNVSEGDTFRGEYSVVEGQTEPPKRYTEADLLSAMELAGQKLDDEETRTLMKLQKKGLGTDATRHNIIKGLFDKEFMKKKGKSIYPTEKGEFLIETLCVENLKSAVMTGEWEMRLNGIAEAGNNPETAYTAFIAEIKAAAREWFAQIKNSAGERFISENERKMLCPFCKKTMFQGKMSYSCSGYKDEPPCKFQVYSVIGGKKITETQVLMLLASGRTGIIKGFTGQKSGKVFDAALKIDREKKAVVYDFADNIKKN